MRLMGFVPDGSQIQTSALPAASDTYAIRLPVGLQAGWSSGSLAKTAIPRAVAAGRRALPGARLPVIQPGGTAPAVRIEAAKDHVTLVGAIVRPAFAAALSVVAGSVSRSKMKSLADWKRRSGTFSGLCRIIRSRLAPPNGVRQWRWIVPQHRAHPVGGRRAFERPVTDDHFIAGSPSANRSDR